MAEKPPVNVLLEEYARAQKHHRNLPVRWQSFESFPVPVRHRCLKLPRSRLGRFLRQQLSRG